MIRNTVVPSVKLTTFLLALIVSVGASAQIIRTDSVNLASFVATRLAKVVSKTDRTQRLALAWQTYNTDSSRLYFRLYSHKGTPVSNAFYLARAVNPVSWVAMDFDVAIRKNGEAVVAWSEFVPATKKFNVKFCLFDVTGKMKEAPKQVAVSIRPYIKTASNSSGGFVIAWDDSPMRVQIFTEQGVPEGGPLQLYNNPLTAQAGVIEYTDEKRLYVGLMFKDQYSAPLAVIHGYDQSGSKLNDPPTSNNVWNLSTGDVSFGNKKTVFSFAYNSATYFIMTSKVSASTMGNSILVDNVAAQLSQVAQNDNGSIGIAWSMDTEVKVGIFHSSGEMAGNQTVVPTGGLTPSSIDVIPGAGSEAAVVVAANSATGAQITFQRFRYQGATETEEVVVNNIAVPTGKVQNALSGVRTHVALWQHKEPTRSAIFAQVYDSLFQKKGDPINVTGFIAHSELQSYFFDFEAAIDSVGNFMVVWQTNNKDVRAVQFNPDGSIKLPEFKVNTSAGDIAMAARIAASPNGKFVIFWRDTGGKVKARLFDKEADSGEKILKEYVWYGNYDAEMRRKNRVAINNRGDFVCTFRTDYYAVQMLIFDASFAEVAAPLHSNLMYSDSNMDLVMNNNQIVLSWAMNGYETGIKVQRFDTRGLKIGALVTADSHVESLRYPSLAMNYKNEFVVAYQDGTQQLQRFSSQGTMVGERRRFTTLGEIPEVKVSQSPLGDVFAVYANDAHAAPGTTTGGYNVIAKGLFNASTTPKVYYVLRTINEGESFDFGSDKLIVAGRYSHLYGTDSLVALTLKVIDQFPPSIPKWNPVVSGDKFVRLSWSPNPEPDFKHYLLYRNTVDVSATAQPLTTTSSYTYEDNSIDYGQRYYYWLVAVDSYNHASSFSTSVNGLAVNTPPAQPKWSSRVGGDKFIEVSWQPNTEVDLKHYQVYRNTTNNQGTAQLIATQTTTTYRDVHVTYNTVYYYWLVAVDTNNGASVFSVVQSAIPKNDPPATPTDIVLVRSNDVVTMTWKANTEPDFLEYRVYRTTTSEWYSPTLIGSPTTNTITFPAIPDVTSFYRIFAVDQGVTFSGLSIVSSDAITKKDQQITFNSLPWKNLNEGSVILQATATSGLPISYAVSDETVATISGNVVTLLSAGTADITATQAGNSEYNAATAVIQSLVVKRSQSITFDELTSGLTIGESVTLQASASSGLPVSFSISDLSVARIADNVMTVVGEGSADITAIQSGNDTYDAAAAVVRKAVVKRVQTIIFETISQPLPIGSSILLRANASSGLPVSYSVSNPTVATISGNVVTLLAAGTVNIIATQPGNGEYNAATPVVQTLVVKRSQIISFSELPSGLVIGASVTLEASASSGLPVVYSVSNSTVATITHNVMTIVGEGSTDVIAVQAGNYEYDATEAVVRRVVVKRSQTVTFEAISKPLVSGVSITLGATASSGLPVTFSVSNPAVATVTGNVVTLLAAGVTNVTATQPGNDEYNASAAIVQRLVIKQAQTLSFEGVPSVLAVGESFALKAVASSGLPVTYETSNGGVALIEKNVITALAEGVVTITATQRGNDVFAAAEPVMRAITVAIVTASESVISENAASLYPNPVTNQITMTLNGFSPGLPINIKIIDVKGTIVHQLSMPAREVATVNVEHLADGQYYVHLKQGAHHAERKFVKR